MDRGEVKGNLVRGCWAGKTAPAAGRNPKARAQSLGGFCFARPRQNKDDFQKRAFTGEKLKNGGASGVYTV